MSDRSYEEGLEVRREVLGAEHVDRAMEESTGLDRDFQRWITESAWAGVWGRPHLDRRTKSLITISILAALGREELELHLRSSTHTGATPEDIAEALFHVGVYAGIPAANHAFKVAKRVLGDAPGPVDGDSGD